jgi:hypothetical protein
MASRTTSPIISSALPFHSSNMVSEIRVPIGNQPIVVPRLRPASETSRVRQTTRSPPSSGVTVTARSAR